MNLVRFLLCTVAAGTWLLAPVAARAQSYTPQPIKIIVPYTPGTGNDILGRLIAQRLGDLWKHTIVVENKPGASGNIGTAQVARAVPDGTTLLVVANSLVINPHVYKDAQYDPLKDLAPVSQLAWGRLLLVANPSRRFASAAALIDTAKANPGKITYASPGPGTPHHVSMELFKLVSGTDLLHVPYKGTAGAVTDILGGTVDTMFLPVHVAMPHVREGKLAALGIGSAKRVPTAAEVPTLAEQGIKGAEVDIWYGLFAPAATPPDIVAKLHRAVNEILESPETRAQLAKQGLDVETATVEEFRSLMQRDSERWGKVVRSAKLTAE